MSQKNWDDLASAAKWMEANTDVLIDTHWIGGDPRKMQVYGWASWSPRKGVIVLRNPSASAKGFSLEVASLFELPAGAATCYQLTSPRASQKLSKLELRAGEPKTIELKPFEVLIFDAKPIK